ncbi:MAG: alanine racemase [Firmicutes bacterium]|nr:alanine racemase [Bacillota bacterium]
MERYPQLVINLDHARENVANLVKRCEEKGIRMTGVIKVVNALPEVCRAYYEGGCKILASSRIYHLRELRELGIGDEFELLRIPMMSEIPEVIRYADISLNSDGIVLRALNEEALRQGKIHRVILMVEVGDLREGYWDRDELLRDALMTERELKGLHLEGVGMNVGCYGSVLPSFENMQYLVDCAEMIEEAIGRRLDVISGGGTSSLMRVFDGDVPERINDLRVGGEPLVAYTLKNVYGYPMEWQHEDVVRVRAEVLEVRDKPSHPIGELAVDAFGHKNQYEDRGIRKRALIGIGRQDYGEPSDIPGGIPGMEILGASSDHTILDIEDCGRDYRAGDIIEFRIKYAQLMFMTSRPDVVIKYI